MENRKDLLPILRELFNYVGKLIAALLNKNCSRSDYTSNLPNLTYKNVLIL